MSTETKITLDPAEWVSHAEAARIRGVSRQAIGKLVRSRRIETLKIGGRTFVKLAQVKEFQRTPPGRKKRLPTPMKRLDEIFKLLGECTEAERLEVFRFLRREIPIHPFEGTFNTRAEVILEAISKAPDLTIQGVRGIIAEASFVVDVAGPLLTSGWRDVTPKGDVPFDCVIEDSTGKVRIQVKMQRQKNHRPMMANEGYRFLPADQFVTETQRTRGGKDSAGASTRPYRFGEFDILAVSLHPSTKRWTDFVYTVASWLLPDPQHSAHLLKFQPVSATRNDDWTDNLVECIGWFRDGRQKRICEAPKAG